MQEWDVWTNMWLQEEETELPQWLLLQWKLWRSGEE
jgi:hypothetical protein